MYLISEFLKPKKVFTRKKSQRNVGMDRKFVWFTADGGGGRIRCLKLIQLNVWRWSSLNGLRRKRRELLLWPTHGAQSTIIIRVHLFCPAQDPVTSKGKLISDCFCSQSLRLSHNYVNTSPSSTTFLFILGLVLLMIWQHLKISQRPLGLPTSFITSSWSFYWRK